MDAVNVVRDLHSVLITPKDYLNQQQHHRLKGRIKETVMKEPFARMDELNFGYDKRHDEDGHVNYLLMIDPRSLEVFKTSSDVLMFDGTYRTNDYGMPLMNTSILPA